MSSDPKGEQAAVNYDTMQTAFMSTFMSHFGILREFLFTIPPWLEPSFWDNMAVDEFQGLYFQTVIDYIHNQVTGKIREGKDKVDEIADYNCLYRSLLFVVIARNKPLKENLWEAKIQAMIDSGLKPLSQVCQYLSLWMGRAQVPPKDWIDGIVGYGLNCELVARCVPQMCFMGLIRAIRSDEMTRESLFPTIGGCFSDNEEGGVDMLLMYLVRLFLTLFPGVGHGHENRKLSTVMEILATKMGHQEPVSSEAATLGKMAETEIRYPGYAYYHHLQDLCEMYVATKDILLFYDPDCKYYTSVLYSRCPDCYGVKDSFISWAQFYVQAKFKSAKRLKPDEALSLAASCGFNEGKAAKMRKKFSIVESEEEVACEIPQPPVLKCVTNKVSCVFDLKPSEPLNEERVCLFLNPSRVLFKVTIDSVVDEYFKANPQEDLLFVPLACFGDDFFLGNILNMCYWFNIDDKKLFNKVIFNIFLLPGPGECQMLADYIASVDPVYRTMVRYAYSTCMSVAPTFEDNSPVTFTSILKKDESHEHNPWFSPPSPTTMYQALLQHYVQFAKRHIKVRIWKAILGIGSELVTVPFFSSLHIGNQFNPFVKDEGSKKKRMTIVRATLMSKKVDRLEVKVYSATLWAVNPELHVRPQDPFLFQQLAQSKGDIKTVRERGKVEQQQVFVWKATPDPQDPTFTVTIDQRVYKNVSSISVSKMVDPADPNEQMVMRVATFLDIGA